MLVVKITKILSTITYLYLVDPAFYKVITHSCSFVSVTLSHCDHSKLLKLRLKASHSMLPCKLDRLNQARSGFHV